MSKSRWIVAVAVLGPTLWLFGRAVFTSESFVFRDAAHYYYPLYQWTSSEWAAGRVPLWNAQENCGMPALAGATSAVFYPGKLIFVLPVDYPTRYKLYIVAHVLLAAAGALALARHFGASITAAGVCGLSYALSGNVMFQYCNVVFLVGAAWLPAAILSADRMLRGRRPAWAVVFGAVLAMMTLGGDPQAAYHAALLAALYAWILWRRERRRRWTPGKRLEDRRAGSRDATRCGPGGRCPPATASDGVVGYLTLCAKANRIIRCRPALLSIAATTGLVLAAVQILPAWEWTGRSDRAMFASPRSLYEIPGYLSRPHGRDAGAALFAGLAGKTMPGDHHRHVYQFSVGPWRLAEYLWPNFAGRQFPVNRRWLGVLPAEGRVWTPSLYMGLLPLVLALGSLRFRGGASWVRWASWFAAAAVAGSFGAYGVGWLVDETRLALWGIEPGGLPIGEPVGGVYWLMTVLLPGYVYFRFPGKLLTVAAAGLSLLAARGWDRAFSKRPARLRTVLATLGAFSAVAAIASLALVMTARPMWNAWMAAAAADDLFGPIDAAGAARDLVGAFVQTAVLCGLFWWLLGRRQAGGNSRWAGLALLLTAIELAAAQGWMVQYAPERIWQEEPKLARAIAADRRRRGADPLAAGRVFRASSSRWTPRSWRESSSPERQRDGLRRDHDSLLPKYHLPTGLAMVETSGTMMSGDYEMLLRVARRHGRVRADGARQPHPAVLDALGAEYLILPGEAAGNGRLGGDLDNVVLLRNPTALPRAWIVHKIRVLPPLEQSDPASVARRTEEVLFPGGKVRDLRREAVVEAARAPDEFPVWSGPAPATDLCRIVYSGPQRVEILADLARPGLVVLSDLYYPGWQVEAATEGVKQSHRPPILRTDRVMRGVYLPPGRHRLTYRYRPRMFFVGAVTSGIGWLIFGPAALIAWRRRRLATWLLRGRRSYAARRCG